ncbi:MAG TPA: Hpt domain-containing protein [Caulobacteraceae bacterium]|jgi:HPt (histidine-containing phosphotransfer) domain-containing protein
MMAGAIDFSHLEHYVGGDLAIIREVLALFSDQARTVLPLLDPAGPADQWRGAAHSLKGSALGIGAQALATACGDAEQARDAPAAEKVAARARIADCLGAVLMDIAAYRSR